MSNAVSFGITGLGGYARWACEQLLMAVAEQDDAAPAIRFVGVCDPDLAGRAAQAQKMRAAGITVVPTLEELLTLPIDALWLPLPIDLHRPFTEKCLAAGKAVLVEKPAAGTVDEVDAMIAARDGSGLPVAVGFQNLFDPATWAVKRKLLAGVIGKPISASVLTCWPRSNAYFARTQWAGRLKHNDTWVLDSPANNAMAHFLNLALFLLGPAEAESATPLAVEAELYRANPIENYDTCCLRYEVAGGTKLLVAYTHACQRLVDPTITIAGERGTMRFWNTRHYEIAVHSAGGATTAPEILPASPHSGMAVVREFAAFMRGMAGAHVATLENARRIRWRSMGRLKPRGFERSRKSTFRLSPTPIPIRSASYMELKRL